MTYYKWLTPAMTSHYDRQYRWRLGEVHGVAEGDAQGFGLHLLKQSVDALHFGHWPGRLFEAEPVGPITAEDQEMVRCRGVRLLRELDSAAVFGPNGVRVVQSMSRLEGFSWLMGEGTPSAAMDAAAEHQARLAPWGWKPVPVKTRSFDDWGLVAESAASAINPAAKAGAWTAWAATGHPWKAWTAPWAAWAAWDTAWNGVGAGAGAAAWAIAKETWKGPVPWPDPRDAAWTKAARTLRAATRAIAAAAADHAALAAEYLVCGSNLPPDPFEPLMEVWRLGYWPVGTVDGHYLVGDLSSLCRRQGAPVDH